MTLAATTKDFDELIDRYVAVQHKKLGEDRDAFEPLSGA